MKNFEPCSYIQWGYRVENNHQHYLKQIHTDQILEIKSKKELLDCFARPVLADASFTFLDHTELFVHTADCVPLVFFTDDANGPIASAHCGWKSIRMGLSEKVLKLMQNKNKNVNVAIGPCIRGCCYEIGDDFIESFRAYGRDIESYVQKRKEKKFVDLVEYLIENDLKNVKLVSELPLCTYCQGFPSYRREKEYKNNICTWIKKV